MTNGIENIINEVMKEFGFHDICIIEQMHNDSERLLYVIEAEKRKFFLRGLPIRFDESVIRGNTMAQDYLGNQNGLAPKIFTSMQGERYICRDGYWFYLLEYLAGENLKENEEDERKLGQLLRKVHSLSGYQYPSNLSVDKSVFYNWFHDKLFKKDFDEILDDIPDFTQYDTCFIHSDAGPHNSIKTTDGKIVFIDLDDAGIGSRYLDLGWPFIMQFVDFNHNTLEMRYRFDLAKVFLKGYYGENKIDKDEYDLLWQGAIFMHISYMQDYGSDAVDSLWNILIFGMKQKELLWKMLHEA